MRERVLCVSVHLDTDEKIQGCPTPLPSSQSRRAHQKAQRAAREAAAAAVRRAEIEDRLAAMTDAERAAWREERTAKRDAARADAAARRARLAAAVAGAAPLRIVIDCGYSDLMTEREAASLGQQLRHCVAANARAPTPALLAWAGVDGATASSVAKVTGADTWPVVRVPRLTAGEGVAAALPAWTGGDGHPPPAAASPPPTYYLSADAPVELDDAPLPTGTTLIVGGLVDRNRHPRAALARAAHLGIPTARLPLRLALTSSAVLTVDCVVGLLLRVGSGEGWGEAAVAAVPKRKQRDGGGGEGREDLALSSVCV